MVPDAAIECSGPNAPCSTMAFPGVRSTTSMNFTPPPAGNFSQKHPPTFSSMLRLCASCEYVCAELHQSPTRNILAYTSCGAAWMLTVSFTVNPPADESTTSATSQFGAIAQASARTPMPRLFILSSPSHPYSAFAALPLFAKDPDLGVVLIDVEGEGIE